MMLELHHDFNCELLLCLYVMPPLPTPASAHTVQQHQSSCFQSCIVCVRCLHTPVVATNQPSYFLSLLLKYVLDSKCQFNIHSSLLFSFFALLHPCCNTWDPYKAHGVTTFLFACMHTKSWDNALSNQAACLSAARTDCLQAGTGPAYRNN